MKLTKCIKQQRNMAKGIRIACTLYSIGFLVFSNPILMATETSEVSVSDTIRFELTNHNNISIKAIINKTDTVDLMFHTAANATTLTREASKILKTIQWDSETDVTSWGGSATARFSESNALEIGSLKWENISIWETENSGPGTDGKFGLNVFEGKTIEIDFDKNAIVIHQSLPDKIDSFQKTRIFFEDDYMFIEGLPHIGDTDYQHRFLIHSGYGGTLLFDDKFVAENKIGEHIEIIKENELKDSYGNVLKVKKGKLSKLVIGDIVFTEIPVGFFEGAIGRQQMSILGGDVLKRFNIIIDSKRDYIYLKPNTLKTSEYSTR